MVLTLVFAIGFALVFLWILALLRPEHKKQILIGTILQIIVIVSFQIAGAQVIKSGNHDLYEKIFSSKGVIFSLIGIGLIWKILYQKAKFICHDSQIKWYIASVFLGFIWIKMVQTISLLGFIISFGG